MNRGSRLAVEGAWATAALVVALTVTLTSLAAPSLVYVLLAVATVGIVGHSLRDGWRRAFVLALIVVNLSASHVDSLAEIGNLGKFVALPLLVVVTLLTKTTVSPEKLPRRAVWVARALWLPSVLATLSALWSRDPAETLLTGVSLAMFAFALQFAMRGRWQDREVAALDVAALYWTSWALLAVGAAMSLTNFDGALHPVNGRWYGLLSNPNLTGMTACLTAGLGIFVALRSKRVLVWITVLLPVWMILQTQSRTALAALAVGMLVTIARLHLSRLITVVVGAGMALTAVSLAGALPELSIAQRFETGSEDSLNGRQAIWQNAIRLATSDPLGSGWATTPNLLAATEASGATNFSTQSIHNSYLQMWVELGIFGLLTALLIVVTILGVALRTPVTQYSAGLIVTVVAGFMIQFTESAVLGIGQPYPYLFWTAMAITAVYSPPGVKSPLDTASASRINAGGRA